LGYIQFRGRIGDHEATISVIEEVAVGSLKSCRSKKGSGPANLKSGYVNGDLGFDPLGLQPSDSAKFDEIRTNELQNGRLAMLGVAGIVAQELVNNKGVIENLLG
jgi:hypothetical protein